VSLTLQATGNSPGPGTPNPSGIGAVDNWRFETDGVIDGQVAMTSATAGLVTVHCIAYTLK
jgi:hypothetical protein